MDLSNMTLRVDCGTYERYGSTMNMALDVQGSGAGTLTLCISEGRALKVMILDKQGFEALKRMVSEAESAISQLMAKGQMTALALR